MKGTDRGIQLPEEARFPENALYEERNFYIYKTILNNEKALK